jgi:hypothetical protein
MLNWNDARISRLIHRVARSASRTMVRLLIVRMPVSYWRISHRSVLCPPESSSKWLNYSLYLDHSLTRSIPRCDRVRLHEYLPSCISPMRRLLRTNQSNRLSRTSEWEPIECHNRYVGITSTNCLSSDAFFSLLSFIGMQQICALGSSIFGHVASRNSELPGQTPITVASAGAAFRRAGVSLLGINGDAMGALFVGVATVIIGFGMGVWTVL